MFSEMICHPLSGSFRKAEKSGLSQLPQHMPSCLLCPCCLRQSGSRSGQGVLYYKKIFGREPEGIWLPECGFVPGFDDYLSKEGITYFFLDTHGILHGRPAPRCGVYAPVACPSGVRAFGRDPETSKQVWSSVAGYPGDFDYRDFYRDIGFDLDLDYIKSYLRPFAAVRIPE